LSKWHKADLRKTIEELVKPTGLISGKNWLRHKGQAQRIDEMLLNGATKQEIAQNLIISGQFTKDLNSAKARVQRHIDHLRKEEHKIPLEVDAHGVWRFATTSQIIHTIVPDTSFSEGRLTSTEESELDDIKI